MATHGPDVFALGDAGHRVLRHASSEGIGPPYLPRSGEPRSAERWERPDEYDPYRPTRPTLAFGGGPHVCLGQHVARAEMTIAINALLDRLPNLRLDPDAEPPRFHRLLRTRGHRHPGHVRMRTVA